MSSDQLTACISDRNNNRIKQNCIENNLNMVVSLPINVVTSNQTVLVLNNHNLSTTTPTLPTNVTTVTSTTQQQEIGTNSTMPSSKYLLLDKNQIIGDAESYADIVNGIGNLQSGNENSGGIVVLATQQINAQVQNQTDEELTPLTWLHDKNLLKGINLSCTKMQSIVSSPQRHMSPTSDFLEDSCVSEENSSINSNSDNGVNSESNYYMNHKKVRNQGSNHHSNESSTMSSSTSSTAPSSLSSPSSINSSPGGQTLIEYHTLSNAMLEDSPKINSECNTSTIISPSSNSVPHQHFHKKYLREEHIRQLEHVGTNSSVGPNIINKTQFKHFINTPQGKYEIIEKDYPTTPNKINPTYNRAISQEVISTFSTSPRQPSEVNNQPILSTIHQRANTLSPKHKSSNNMAYDPKIHTNNKPPYSFSSLIFMAIEDSPEKALPVKEIYAWIVQRFPYFKTAPTGWKNSVRHNLSLSKSFQKVEKAPNMGKGSLWRVDKHYRHNLVQTVSRSQMHPCATIEKTSMKSIPRPSNSPAMLDELPSLVQNGHNGIVMQNGQNSARALDAELFPRLSRYMAQMTTSNGTVIDRPSPSSTPADDDYTQNYRNADEYYHKISNGCITNNNGSTLTNNNNCTLFANRNFSPDRLVRDFDTENIDDVNAAKAMLALKHGPKVFGENYHSPVITSSPSEDHTYSQGVNSANGANNVVVELNNNNIIESALSVRLVDHHQIHSDNNSNGTSSDAAYESSEEGNHHQHQHRNDITTPVKHNRNSDNFYAKPINHNNNGNVLSNAETEEQRRHAEGVDALLNLAGVTFTAPITLKRLSTTSLSDIQHQNNHSSNINNNSNNSSNQIIYQHSPSKKVKTKSVRNKLRKSFGEIK